MPAKLSLYFCGDLDRPQLARLEFNSPMLDCPRVSVRGKTGLPGGADYSFPWTSAVQAICILTLKHAALAGPNSGSSAISSKSGSPAASLDNALFKHPNWLLDMFGTDSNGSCLLNRLITKINPGQKRPEPTVIAIRPEAIAPSNISIYLEAEQITKFHKEITLY